MNATTRSVRRILVALDAGPDNLARLEQAATLAADLRIELTGLFVEDDDLFRLCGLPVREISLGSGVARRPDLATMQRELRVHQAEARRRLQDVAARRRVSWSFEVRRGRGRDILLGAAGEADLVAMARSGFMAGRRSGADTALPAPVVTVFEGGEDAGHVLHIAARTARQHGAPLLVLTADRLADAARAALSAADIDAGLRPLRTGKAALLRSLRLVRPRLLVLAAGGAVSRGLLDDMLMAADCEGLLIGGA